MQAHIQHIFDKAYQSDEYRHWMTVCAKDAKIFLEFWSVAKDPNVKLAWRALWIMEHAVKKNDTLLDLILEELYLLLVQTDNHSILRMGLKLVILRPLNNDEIGVKLLNKCEEILLNTKMPIATRANSLQYIFEFCKIEKDFINELQSIIDHISDHETSSGMKARIRIIKKALSKM